MAMYLLMMFGISLLLTIGVELAVVFLFCSVSSKDSVLSGEEGKRPEFLRMLLLVVLLNCLTNPPAVLLCWLGRLYLPGLPRMILQLPVEAAVVVTESLVYCGFAKKPEWKIRHPVLLAVTANGCSWLLGMIGML